MFGIRWRSALFVVLVSLILLPLYVIAALLRFIFERIEILSKNVIFDLDQWATWHSRED